MAMMKTRTSRTLLDHVRGLTFHLLAHNELRRSRQVDNSGEKRLRRVRGPTFRLLPFNK